MIAPEKLHALGIGPEWSEPLTTTFATFGINDVNRQAAFIGQCSHECNHFKTLEENLNYRPETLHALFGHKFKPEEIAVYAHHAEKIANRIYANRMGNRDEASGDGWKFHGRGCIQLTGHDNYWHFGKSIRQDMVAHPELVATPMYAALSAGWFWSTHGCNDLAEAGNEEGLCKRINGGTFGLAERINLTKHALAVLGA
jgi:putative chitinase